MAQGDGSLLDKRLKKYLDGPEFDALLMWCENKECKITWKQWLTGGRTQAILAVVLIRDGYTPRKGVLKYCPPPRTGVPTDYRAFKKALDSGPSGFAKDHLIGIDPAADDPIPGGPGLFLLMKYVGGDHNDYDNYNTMAPLLGREILGTACKTIIKSTLAKWNDAKNVGGQSNDDLPAVDFLREILGDRCEQGGPIRAVADKLGTSYSTPFLQGPQWGVKSNPLAAATRLDESINEMSVIGFRGNSHGDLHPDNILIPLPHQGNAPSVAEFEHYVLVDLSKFRSNGLLAVDPAHLLLSIIASGSKNDPDALTDNLARLVLDPEYERGRVSVALANAIREIWDAGVSFPASNMRKEWSTEFTLAIAGCALLFVGRNLSDEHSRWFLNLAGMAIDVLKGMQPKRDRLAAEGDTAPRDQLPHYGQAPATRPAILSNEMASFRIYLMEKRQQYRSQLALDIGHASLRRFADHLDAQLDIYDAALADDSASIFSAAQRDALMDFNFHIEMLTGLVRELALLVQWHVKPTRPGELSAAGSDLNELHERLSGLTESIESLANTTERVKSALARQPGGGVDHGPQDERNRPYRRAPIVAINEYRR
jgi:hypothetical protein